MFIDIFTVKSSEERVENLTMHKPYTNKTLSYNHNYQFHSNFKINRNSFVTK